MTDGQLVKVMARLQRLTDKTCQLIDDVIVEHPNSSKLRDELHANGLGYAWDCMEIVVEHLEHPERWVCENNKLVYQGVCSDD